MISYAQNLEDVMLSRALGHIDSGFYIDVGANDPVVDSVTKAFYDRGWHGINIEPIPSHHADLVRERPRDINLQCAVGAQNGHLEIWECDVRGWATASADVISQHEASGLEGVFHSVPMYQLSELCAKHASSTIHFLKIDVEGFERFVIDGMDFSRFRPWIVVIEATRPNSTEESSHEWEGDIFSSGYSLAYADGLNRFYASNEHPELVHPLRYPPNVFDGYIRSEQANSELRAQEAESKALVAESKAQVAESKAQVAESKAQVAESKAQEAESKAQEAESKAQEAESKAQQYWTKAEHAYAIADECHAQLMSVYSSTFWRSTKPLRWTLDHLRVLTSLRMQGRLKRLMRGTLFALIGYIGVRPRLKRFTISVASRSGLSSKLRRIYWGTQAVSFGFHGVIPMTQDLRQLNPRARQIYSALKQAIEHRHEDSR